MAEARISAHRPGGAHALDVFFAGEKTQQHFLVADFWRRRIFGAGL